jgi:hypothetical protein
MKHDTGPARRPALRIIPRERPALPAHRVWRQAWRDAYERTRQDRENGGGRVDHAA